VTERSRFSKANNAVDHGDVLRWRQSHVLQNRNFSFHDTGYDRLLKIVHMRIVSCTGVAPLPNWLFNEGENASYAFLNAVLEVSRPFEAQDIYQRVKAFEAACENQDTTKEIDASKLFKRIKKKFAHYNKLANRSPHVFVSTMRCLTGISMERWIVNQSVGVPLESAKSSDLMMESYAASAWTSVHSEYVSWCVENEKDVEEEGSSVEEDGISNRLIKDRRESSLLSAMQPRCPSLLESCNMDSEYSIGSTINWGNVTTSCSKHAHPMHQLVNRSLIVTHRGWNTALKRTLTESWGTRTIVVDSLIVSLCGMHAFVHPSCRPSYEKRMKIERLLRGPLTRNAASSGLTCLSGPIKECMRRVFFTVLQDNRAAADALKRVGNVAASLVVDWKGRSNVGMIINCNTIALAGSEFVDRISRCDTQIKTDQELVKVLVDCLCQSCLDTSRRVSSKSQRLQGNKASSAYDGSWWTCGNWLPKASVSHHKMSVTRSVANLTNLSFQSLYFPIWMQANTSNIKFNRLEECQHTALHLGSKVMELCSSLDDRSVKAVRKCALQTPNASLMCCESVCRILGIPFPDECKKHPNGTLGQLLAMPPRHLALLTEFAMTSSCKDEMLTFELGRHESTLQKIALLESYDVVAECTELLIDRHNTDAVGFDVDQDIIDKIDRSVASLPMQATHVCICLECCRVANTRPPNIPFEREKIKQSRKFNLGFNEVGIKMVMVDSSDKKCLYCARRSSAAFRSAYAAEQRASSTRIDEVIVTSCTQQKDCEEGEVEPLEIDSAVLSKMKRDCRKVIDQRSRATPCGGSEMLAIPLVGKMVRLMDSWFTLCCFCGCCVESTPARKQGACVACNICRFDACRVGSLSVNTKCKNLHEISERMLRRTVENASPFSLTIKNARSIYDSFLNEELSSCRFCNAKVNFKSRSATRLTRHHSPLDRKGRNSILPPELRTTTWCRKHNPSWLKNALQTLRSNVVLAHIASGAKPVFVCGSNELTIGSELQSNASNKKRRKFKRKPSERLDTMDRSANKVRKTSEVCLDAAA